MDAKVKSESRIRYWYLDLLGMIASGLFIGYFRQHVADSGQSHPDEILKSMSIGGCAYLLGFIILMKREMFWRVPYWVTLAIAGSAVCSFSLHIVKYAVDNWAYRKSDSVVRYLLWLLPDMAEGFIVSIIFYSLIALCIIGVIRLLAVGLKSLRGA
jgi:hypothetical protein